MARSGSGRVRQRLTGLAAVLVMVAMVVGVPVLLVAISGSPVPSSVPSLAQVWARLTSQDDGTLLLGLVRVVAWVAWLVFVVSLLAELLARVRGLPAPQLPGLRVPQSAARGLVAAAVVLFVAAPAVGAAVRRGPMRWRRVLRIRRWRRLRPTWHGRRRPSPGGRRPVTLPLGRSLPL